MNAAKMTLASTVVAAAVGLALGLMNTPAQAHCKGKHVFPHEHCTPGATYTVQLFDGDSSNDGAFCLDVFGAGTCHGAGGVPVDVTASSDGTLLVGVTLLLTRPGDGGDLDDRWDGVFNTCPGLFVGNVGTLTADNWRVKLAPVTGKEDEVRVQFIRATPENAETEVTLQLIDRGPYDFDGGDSFLPVSAGESKTYALDDYQIFGQSVKGTNPRLRCGNGDHFEPSLNIDLVITAN